MLDEAAATTDPAARVELIRKAIAYVFAKAPVWFHNSSKGVLAVQAWLHGAAGNVTETAILEVDDMWPGKDAPGRSE